jgi:hypothetical protein
MALSQITKIGIAREASWGTSTAPTVLVPVTSDSQLTPQFEHVMDQAMRGLPVLDYEAYTGVARVEGSVAGPVYPDEIGYFLLGAMGSVSTSAGTHTFEQYEYPPSFSIQDENGVQTFRYEGCMVSELTLSWNSAEGFLTYSASIVGKDWDAAPSGAVPADATTTPFMGWQAAVSFNGSPSGKFTEGEITLSREILLRYADSNSQRPTHMCAGPIEVTVTGTLVYDAATEMNLYLAGTKPSFEVAFTSGDNVLTFSATKCSMLEGPPEIDRSEVCTTMSVGLRALYNTTDSGSCVITLSNDTADYNA